MAREVFDKEVVTYYLRDMDQRLVDEWSSMFADYEETVKASKGDIFEGAPAVDAIVSPANSFGFMDGGIDYVYTKHFGGQMQDSLQKLLREKFQGELPVGQAVIIPAYREGAMRDPSVDWCRYNHGEPIRYLISAPTMRVPSNVAQTVNAYLAFRAVILEVEKHNQENDKDLITRVLVPGLGTMVGKMPKKRCAYQMLEAYRTFAKGEDRFRIKPKSLGDMWKDHQKMCEFGGTSTDETDSDN
ncbi:uncharacterized protein LOC131953147 [Physella acuta]|uniref:uncharacterized protein LOC131953147 n=1 Tax=Physella acuta TaxID=109671 RepID=UPI0027DE2B3F|nr:uncharacterized protein LOC131953147 [Physella acuta]XP_059172178.1 uncharacterized protein LOC131953147 [Physella acuta]